MKKNIPYSLSKSDLYELFEYVEKRKKIEPLFYKSIIEMYQRNSRWSNIVFRWIVYILSWRFKPQEKSIKYYFWGIRFKEIILSLPVDEVCIVGGPKQLFFCVKHHRHYLPCLNMWNILLSGLLSRSTIDNSRIANLIRSFAVKLKKNASPLAVLIVDNDSLPMQRTAVLAARVAGIHQTVCVQHGIFQSKSPGHIMDGWFADKMFVMNEIQRFMLIKKGMDPKKIKVMGFHTSPYLPERSTSLPGQRRICFLGQPWSKYSDKIGMRYLEIVERIMVILRANELDVVYKPHPGELGCKYLAKIKNVINAPLSVIIENYDVFISLTSTALIETEVAGRISIQITDSNFDCDPFQVYGEIVSIDYCDKKFKEKLCNAINSNAKISKKSLNASDGFLKTINSYE